MYYSIVQELERGPSGMGRGKKDERKTGVKK